MKTCKSAFVNWNSPSVRRWKSIAIKQAATAKLIRDNIGRILKETTIPEQTRKELEDVSDWLNFLSLIPTRPYDLHHWIIRDEFEPSHWEGLILASDGKRVVLTRNRDLDYIPFVEQDGSSVNFKATFWQPVNPPSRTKI
jgi:hypothetical protein